MQSTSNAAFLLSLIAPLFSHLTENDYADTARAAASHDARAAARALARDAGERASYVRALELPSWPVRSALQNDVLVPGMPFAAMPVESLYKPWSAAPGNEFGAVRGLYLGDPARHLRDVYALLEIDVPAAFASMPDHLTLELELLALLLAAGNDEAARDLVHDHLDWLGEYDAALAARAEGAARSEAVDGARRAAVLDGIDHLRGLAELAEGAARKAMQPASVP